MLAMGTNYLLQQPVREDGAPACFVPGEDFLDPSLLPWNKTARDFGLPGQEDKIRKVLEKN